MKENEPYQDFVAALETLHQQRYDKDIDCDAYKQNIQTLDMNNEEILKCLLPDIQKLPSSRKKLSWKRSNLISDLTLPSLDPIQEGCFIDGNVLVIRYLSRTLICYRLHQKRLNQLSHPRCEDVISLKKEGEVCVLRYGNGDRSILRYDFEKEGLLFETFHEDPFGANKKQTLDYETKKIQDSYTQHKNEDAIQERLKLDSSTICIFGDGEATLWNYQEGKQEGTFSLNERVLTACVGGDVALFADLTGSTQILEKIDAQWSLNAYQSIDEDIEFLCYLGSNTFIAKDVYDDWFVITIRRIETVADLKHYF